MPKASDAEAPGARERLREALKPGDTVYTCMRHRRSDGMSRRFTLHIIAPDSRGKPSIRDITYLTGLATGFRYDTKHEALTINGCGMDMGYHCVYSLSRVLFPEGFKLPEGVLGRNGDTSGFDTDGGYALEHRHL